MAEKRADKPRPTREKKTAGNAGDGARPDARSPKSLGGGQWALCVVSIVIALAGGGLWAYAAATGDAAPDQSSAARATDERAMDGPGPASDSDGSGDAGDLVSGFVGNDSQLPGDDEPTDASASAGEASTGQRWLDTWSPSIFRLGFSFFVGFAIGYALRAFVKITLIVLGAGFLGMFLLQYAGVVDVNWGLLEGHYDEIVGWLKREGSGFTEFATGYLPSAGSAMAGLVIGFRRKR